jgi:hypothetical protein
MTCLLREAPSLASRLTARPEPGFGIANGIEIGIEIGIGVAIDAILQTDIQSKSGRRPIAIDEC